MCGSPPYSPIRQTRLRPERSLPMYYPVTPLIYAANAQFSFRLADYELA